MGLKDAFSKLNLSGIGAKLKALGQKFPFRKRVEQQTELPPDATTEPVTAEPVTAEAGTDPMLEAPGTGNAFKRFLARSGAAVKTFAGTVGERATVLARQIKENFPKDIDDLKKIQPDELFERFRQMTGGRSSALYLRLFAAGFAAYFLADTVSLLTDSLVPDPPPVPAPIVRHTDEKRRSITEYAAIVDRDIFSSTHTIPTTQNTGVARKTSLPLNLIGTVVLRNPKLSIATIEDRSANIVYPVRIDDVMNNQIQIKEIEHLKVTFVNLSTGQLEYVEIIEDQPAMRIEAARPAPASGKKSEGGVTQIDETHVQLEQKVITDGMANLNEVLQQARAVPNFENGMPNGYKILQIVPGSVFDKFGMKNGDVITGLNGESINDPGKALALLNDLPNARHVELQVQRGGRKMTMNYDIH